MGLPIKSFFTLTSVEVLLAEFLFDGELVIGIGHVDNLAKRSKVGFAFT